MNRAGNVAVAVGLGYVLGRKRKLRSALMLAAAAATGHLGKGPLGRMLVGGASGDSHGSGDGGGPALLGRLGGAGMSAARSALGKPVEMLADRLNERAEALRPGGRSGGEDEQS